MDLDKIYTHVPSDRTRLSGEAGRKSLDKTEQIIRINDDTTKNRTKLEKMSIDGKVYSYSEMFELVNTSNKWSKLELDEKEI